MHDAAQRVLLISVDGFRADYLSHILANAPSDTTSFPAFRWLLSHGTRAQAMQSQFPTVTFPNHWVIATGLYPAWSGIIANSFLLRNASGSFRFNMQTLDTNFWLGEPIWLTAQKAGLYARTYFWPGSEVALQNWDPAKTAAKFDGSVSPMQRVDNVLAMYTSDKPPQFATLYFDDVDHAGHGAGPDSAEVEAAITTVDAALWHLFQGLNNSHMLDSTHIILVSDHGMAGTCGCGRVIPVNSILPPGMAGNDTAIAYIKSIGGWLDGNSVGVPCDGCSVNQIRALAASMNAAAAASGFGNRFRAYANRDLPARINGYGNSSRVPPVIGLVDIGYLVSTRNTSSYGPGCAGTHGWDNAFAAMHATLIAAGPRFVPASILPPPSVAGKAGAGVIGNIAGGSAGLLAAEGGSMMVPNVEVYNLMAEIMGIKPAPNNGTTGYAKKVLLPRC